MSFRKWVTIGPDGLLPDEVRQHLATPDDLTVAIIESEAYADARMADVRKLIVPIVVGDTPPVGPSVGALWVDTN